MEITEKTKRKAIIIGVGTTVVSSIGGILGFLYYKKMKKQAKIDELIAESETDITQNYQDERPILRKLKDAVVNKLYPQDYEILPKIYPQDNRTLDDLEEYERRNVRRNRFTIFDSVGDRLKILETHGDKGVMVRGTGRLRVSGNVHKRTPSGYNKNNRNVNFADLGLGD